jgi:glycosyltransferase involved in cell wall biosynthesis
MRIALCLEYPIGQFGGTEVLVSELIRGLKNHHEIVLVSPDKLSTLDLPSLGRLSAHFEWKPQPISEVQSRELAADLAKEKIALAHFHFGGNYGWGNRYWPLCPIMNLSNLGVPCMSTNHGAFSIMDGYCGSQRSLWFKLALFLPAWFSKQRVLSRLRVEVAVSQHDYRALRRWYWPMRSKFRQIYHSRIQHVEPSDPAQRGKTIINVGTIGERKGQTILADAFARIAPRKPDWKLVLIGRPGDEALTRQIRATISEHRLDNQVQWLTECSDAELDQWLDRAGIFAMPSLREGLGLSLQEALARGCTCVGSRVGGIPDLIQDGDNGLLVEPGDAGQLAAALEKLMSDDELRRRLGARGPKSILEKEMTAGQMVEKYERLYQEVLRV